MGWTHQLPQCGLHPVHTRGLDDVQNSGQGAHHDGCHTRCFQIAREQSNGLMTDRSPGNQQRRVDLMMPKAVQDAWRRVLVKWTWVRLVTHEAIMLRGHGPDQARCG